VKPPDSPGKEYTIILGKKRILMKEGLIYIM